MSASPAAPSLPSDLSPPRWLLPLVLATATLVFLPTLGGGFLGDDFVYIARFRELPWSAWPELFIRDWSGGIWGHQLRELRPFAALSFMGDAKLFGGWAPGYRLTNLALHLVATALVTRLAWRYLTALADTTAARAAALTTGLVFALHPAHAEAVMWVTGRVDLLATTAALLFWSGAESFSAHGRRACAVVTLAAFFLGIFSKELLMFGPLLLTLRWLILDFRAPRAVWFRRARLLGATLVIFGAYAVARRLAFGSDHLGYNLWTEAPAWHRQASHFGWFFPVLPFTGRAEWAAPLPLATLHAIWLTLAGVTIAGLAFTLRRRAHLAAAAFFFGGVWYFVTVFPLTGVIYFSPRHLYFPTVGLALAAGFVVALLPPRFRLALSAAVTLWCAAALVPAAAPWQNAGRVSRTALTALETTLASAPAGSLALTHVPDTLGSAWLWAWSSTQCYGAPFLTPPLPPSRVIERPINYTHTDRWIADRKPVETLRAAPGAAILYVSADGHITTRVATRPELAAAAERLAAAGLSNESWEATVKSLAFPPSP